MQKNKEVFFSIIIVNYESRDFLSNCLESIDKFITPILKENFEIIIVNNDKINLELKRNFSFDLEIIENNKNLGFGSASNQGAKNANLKYLFFLNPDTEFKNDSFVKVIEYIKNKESEKENIGILGIKILDIESNEVQDWSCGNKTSLWNVISRNIFVKKLWEKNEITSVDWVTGAAMIVERKLFNDLNGFDDNFFMYFEDQDLCLRAKELKSEVVYFCFGEVFHWGGKSWSEEKLQKVEYYKSQDYFFEKHFGKWQSWVLRFFRGIFK